MNLSWMGWSWPTAIFFLAVLAILATMGVLQIKAPSAPRIGFLGFATQRGDRLFIALVGSAYIHLAWLALTDASLWIALALSAAFAVLVFRFA
jgi:predicted small integral membrane protein